MPFISFWLLASPVPHFRPNFSSQHLSSPVPLLSTTIHTSCITSSLKWLENFPCDFLINKSEGHFSFLALFDLSAVSH